MSCNSCKKKERFDQMWEDSKSGIETKTIGVVVVVLMLAVYGTFEIISKLFL